MKKTVLRIICILIVAVLSASSAFVAFAVSDNYLYNSKFHTITIEEATSMFNSGRKFICVCYCRNNTYSSSLGTNVISEWMNKYDKDIYGIKEDVPMFVWNSISNRVSYPVVSFVDNGNIKTYHKDNCTDLEETVNKQFFSFYGISYNPDIPIEPKVKKRTQAEIISYIKNHPFDTSVKDTFVSTPSVTYPYNVGGLSQASKINALNALNVVRYISGLSEVTWDSSKDYQQQAGALVSAANRTISHYPSKPLGFDQSIYDSGCSSCSESNLSAGRNSAAGTVFGYMSDSDSSNISRVGHRRWCANPSMGKTSFGMVLTDSGYGAYSTMYAFDNSNTSESSDCRNVPWPAQNTPVEYFDNNDAWSLSTGKTLDASAVSVKLTRNSDGKVWNFSSSYSNGYFNVDNSNCGLPGCIIFRPNNLTINSGDSYSVYIDSGKEKIAYTVNFFKLDNSGSDNPGSDTPQQPAVITSISLKTLPSKTIYKAGEMLDTNGLAVTAYYSDGTSKYVSTGLICTPVLLKNEGVQTITVQYEGKTTTFNVAVNASDSGFAGKIYASQSIITLESGETQNILLQSSQELPSGYFIGAKFSKNDGTVSAAFTGDTVNSSRTIQITGNKPGTETIFAYIADSNGNYVDSMQLDITVIEEEQSSSTSLLLLLFRIILQIFNMIFSLFSA